MRVYKQIAADNLNRAREAEFAERRRFLAAEYVLLCRHVRTGVAC